MHLTDFDGEALKIPLADDYVLSHGPYNPYRGDKRLYVGRDRLIESLTATLHDTRQSSGSYLVAGYRGHGKTSVVNRALELYRRQRLERRILQTPILSRLARSYLGNRTKIQAKRTLDIGFRQLCHPSMSLQEVRKFQFSWPRRWLQRTASSIHQITRKLLGWIYDPPIAVRINLGHDQTPTPREVLVLIAHALDEKLNRHSSQRRGRFRLLPTRLFVLLGLFTLTVAWIGVDSSTVSSILGVALFTSISHVALVVLALLMVLPILIHWFSGRARLASGIRLICERLELEVTNQQSLTIGTSRLGTTTREPAYTTARIEAELQNLLNAARDSLFGSRDILIVFDELDKINTVNGQYGDATHREHSISIAQQVRERKHAVDRLLSGLKNFITTSNARFIFIAGREMLDSYQAERGNTNALYESIFHQVFPVDSLLTDRSDERIGSVYSLVETFVCRRLFSSPTAMAMRCLDTNKEDLDGRTEMEKISLGDVHIGLRKWKNVLDNKAVDLVGNGYESHQSDYEAYQLGYYYNWMILAEMASTTLPPGSEEYKAAVTNARQKAERVVFTLRQFVQFLTVHSWGNSRRLCNLFESFVSPESGSTNSTGITSTPLLSRQMILRFNTKDERRFFLGSELYTLLHRSLSRQLGTSGDKVVVSTMATFQAILKFHAVGFSRYHLLRMSEMLNVYRPPELHRLTDTLVTNVLRPHLRKIRNGLFVYRFNLGLEESIRFISQTDDMESSAFNFSLDSMEDAKAHYESGLRKLRSAIAESPSDGTSENRMLTGLHIVLGDYHFLEQDFDTSAVHYQAALGAQSISRESLCRIDFEYFVRRVEAWLKLGNVEERRQRYERSASCYRNAEREVSLRLKYRPLANDKSHEGDNENTEGGNANSESNGSDVYRNTNNDLIKDPKFDILRQPFWARRFLNLKSGMKDYNSAAEPLPPELFGKRDHVERYRRAQIEFYAGNYKRCKKQLVKSINFCTSSDLVDFHEHFTVANAANLMAQAQILEELSLFRAVLENETVPNHERPTRTQRAILTTLYKFDQRDDGGQCSIDDLESRSQILFRSLESSLLAGQKLCEESPIQLMYFSSYLLEKAGLYYHASTAQINIVSLWSMLIDSLRFDDLIFYDAAIGSEDFQKLTRGIVENQYSVISQIGQKSWKNAETLEGRASALNLQSWTTRNLRPIWSETCKNFVLHEGAMDSPKGRVHIPVDSLKNDGPKLSSATNFMDSLEQQASGGPVEYSRVWCRTGVFPKTVAMLRWTRFVALSALSDEKAHTGGCYWCIGRPNTHSVRFIAINEWLDGRKLLLRARKHPDKIDFKELKIDDLFDAIVCFYQAAQYVQRASINEQSLMFPPVCFIFYNIWEAMKELYDLTSKNSPVVEFSDLKMEVKSKMVTIRRSRIKWCTNPSADNEDQPAWLTESSTDSQRTLFVSSERYVTLPSSICDIEYVANRAMRHLKAVERVGDLSSRAGAEILRNKYYLQDDYQSPEAHFDWVTVQVIRPTAEILYSKIELDLDTMSRGGGMRERTKKEEAQAT